MTVATSIEYCHVYADGTLDVESHESVVLLHEFERHISGSRQRVVMVDDYSPRGPHTMTVEDVVAQLTAWGAVPDVVIRESDLIPAARCVLDGLGDTRLGRQLTRYVATHHRYPCSLFIATWYLIRLGVLPRAFIALDAPVSLGIEPAEQLVNILPERFREFEDRAREILAVIHADVLRRLDNRYYATPATSPSTAWDAYDPDTYVLNNYLTLHPFDVYDLAAQVATLHRHAPLHTGIDVGTGPGLLSVLAMLPYVEQITVVEPGAANGDYLRRQQVAMDPVWDDACGLLASFDPALATFDFQSALRKQVTVVRGTAADIARLDRAEVVSMHYVAEAASDSAAVMQTICEQVARAVQPHGLFLGTFMENHGDGGYWLNETWFPVVSVTAVQVAMLFQDLLPAHHVAVDRIETRGVLRPGAEAVIVLTAEPA